jgi:E3 ubiquitin-protein ligase RHA2
MSTMASVRTALLLLLLPPVSVLLAAAVRCLGRVAARAHHQFPAVGVEKGAAAAMPPVALYYYHDRSRRRTTSGEEQQQHEQEQEQAEECVFCLTAIEEGSEVRELRCRHLFHRGCLDRWLLARPLATCPLCRCRLRAAAPAPARVEDDSAAAAAAELESESDSDSDMTLFVACVHSRSAWLWPS